MIKNFKNFSGETVGTLATALGYEVSYQAGGSWNVQNTTFGNSMYADSGGATWVGLQRSGANMTNDSDVSVRVNFATASQFYLYTYADGFGADAFPTRSYCVTVSGTTLTLGKLLAAGGLTTLATGTVSFVQSDVILRLVIRRGMLYGYCNGGLVCQVRDTTYTSGWFGTLHFNGGTYIQDINISDPNNQVKRLGP